MFMTNAIFQTSAGRRVEPASDRASTSNERGSALVEWLGISALSIGMLVGIFAALEQVGLSVIEAIRGSLGV